MGAREAMDFSVSYVFIYVGNNLCKQFLFRKISGSQTECVTCVRLQLSSSLLLFFLYFFLSGWLAGGGWNYFYMN